VPFSWNLGTLTSWHPLDHSSPVTGLLYLITDCRTISKSPGRLQLILTHTKNAKLECLSTITLELNTLEIYRYKSRRLEATDPWLTTREIIVPRHEFFFPCLGVGNSLLISCYRREGSRIRKERILRPWRWVRWMGFWPSKMGSIGSPETSVRIYHSSLRNKPEERGSHFWCLPKYFRYTLYLVLLGFSGTIQEQDAMRDVGEIHRNQTYFFIQVYKTGKVIPLQARCGPEGG